MKCTALLLIASLIVMPTTALSREGSTDALDFEAQLQQTAEQLELSDAQLDQLTPILRTQFDETRAVLKRHGIDERSVARPDRKKLLVISGELNALRKATEPQVAAILSEEQMAAYRKITDEQRARMRARIRAGAR